MKKYTVEFIGTFFLVLSIVLAVAKAGALAPLAIGTLLVALVYAGGPISAAHYNPAVTFAMWLQKKTTGSEVPGYLIAQFFGGILAAVTANFMLGVSSGSGLDVILWPALLSEFLGTFALVFVILSVAISPKAENNQYYGIAIGFVVTGLAFTLGGISGGAFNPAVAVGVSVAGLFTWANLWIYLSASLLAGALASVTFTFVDSED